ncbi:hypothetical protein CLF_109280 [Clonorchis sinensis]|uniref:Ciliogenesis-associated TTC17-interacting protein n=1 Tax=Clonorchis sinensis TaxID=79923 RepID=G7YJ55_CLOSI|nr:hypothetical protein CLF_109280 [Clonorchis sinensis]
MFMLRLKSTAAEDIKVQCIAERDTHGLAGHQGLIRITASTNGKIESTQFVTTLDALVDFNLATISQTHVEKTTIYLNDRTLPIGKQEVRVNGIERTVHSTVGLPLSWQTYFMADGHLILRLQVGSPIVIKIQEVPERFVQDQFLEQPEIPRPEFNWRDDMELYSRFLSQKDAIKADYLLYLRNHPVVKEMLSDFLQALLMRKPDNTIEFAVEFFKSFSSAQLPTPHSQLIGDQNCGSYSNRTKFRIGNLNSQYLRVHDLEEFLSGNK